jgi:phosphatidylglycerophosphate synthase
LDWVSQLKKCYLNFTLIIYFVITVFQCVVAQINGNDPGITITQKQATIGMLAISVLVLFWLLSHIFWWTLSTSGFLIGIHALLRDASMHKDQEDIVEMSGDLALDEDAAFLNPVDGKGADVI